MLVGAPLGGAYVASVPYRVTAGDVGTMWSSAAIGATAAYAAVANSQPTQATQSGVLLAGGALGHGFMVEPAARNTDASTNYCPHCLSGGGVGEVYSAGRAYPNGLHGVCGDPAGPATAPPAARRRACRRGSSRTPGSHP